MDIERVEAVMDDLQDGIEYSKVCLTFFFLDSICNYCHGQICVQLSSPDLSGWRVPWHLKLHLRIHRIGIREALVLLCIVRSHLRMVMCLAVHVLDDMMRCIVQ